MSNDNLYIRNAVRHYASLFTFPSHKVLLLFLLLLNTISAMFAFGIIFLSYEGLSIGLLYGLLVLTLPALISDLYVNFVIAKNEIVLNPRRCTALSLVSCIFWGSSLIAGSLIQNFFHNNLIIIYASIFGMSGMIALRLLVFSSVSFLDESKAILSTIIQPLLCFTSGLLFFKTDYGSLLLVNLEFQDVRFLLIAFFSSLLILVSTRLFIHLVDRHGKKPVGIGAITLLKSFIANWTEGTTSFIESHFEKLGIETIIPVTMLAFGKKGLSKAVMVIPLFHPGPFKNIGSSNLPFRIQKTLEKKLGSVVVVPHGTSGHDFNLTSQKQCDKVLQGINDLATFEDFDSKATRLFRGKSGSAKATCQFFGDVGLVTVTCAPKNMEDVPFEIGMNIAYKGVNLGAKHIAVIDAHNSIEPGHKIPVLTDIELCEIQKAAESAINSALKGKRSVFKTGASRVVPSKWGLEQGLGFGGIAAFVFQVEEQKVAYIVIDGNNVVSGLREKILDGLRNLNIDDGEVLTTDCHAVNAIELVKKGYNAIGEVIDHKEIVLKVKETVSEALQNLQRSEVAYKVGEITEVKTLGKDNLIKLSLLVDSAFNRAKVYALIIFPSAILAIILLFFLF